MMGPGHDILSVEKEINIMRTISLDGADGQAG